LIVLELIDHHLLQVFLKLALFLKEIIYEVFFYVLVKGLLLRIVLVIELSLFVVRFSKVGGQVTFSKLVVALLLSAVG
jgi:hypothetical protein